MQLATYIQNRGMPKTALCKYLWDISSGSNKQLAQKDFRDFLRELFFLEIAFRTLCELRIKTNINTQA
jgi:hypothetical protein